MYNTKAKTTNDKAKVFGGEFGHVSLFLFGHLLYIYTKTYEPFQVFDVSNKYIV